jgi:hypothetical protein
MEGISHVKTITNQSRKFHEKERVDENIGYRNRPLDSEREAPDQLPETVRERWKKVYEIENNGESRRCDSRAHRKCVSCWVFGIYIN